MVLTLEKLVSSTPDLSQAVCSVDTNALQNYYFYNHNAVTIHYYNHPVLQNAVEVPATQNIFHLVKNK